MSLWYLQYIRAAKAQMSLHIVQTHQIFAAPTTQNRDIDEARAKLKDFSPSR